MARIRGALILFLYFSCMELRPRVEASSSKTSKLTFKELYEQESFRVGRQSLPINCFTVGLQPHPVDPTMYIRCVKIRSIWYHYIYTCPLGTTFDDGRKHCVVPAITTPPSVTTPTTTSTQITTIPTTTPLSMNLTTTPIPTTPIPATPTTTPNTSTTLTA